MAAASLFALRWAVGGSDRRRRLAERQPAREERNPSYQRKPSSGSLFVVGLTAVLFVAGVVLTTLLAVNGFVVDLDQRVPDVARRWPITGNADAGRAAILAYECRACHSVPGLPELARHGVGPPLHGIGRRAYIGGVLPNNPENLVSWLRDPPRYAPGTAMPNMGLEQATARDIAAYLYDESRP